jgi:selenium-binding protein 1
MLNYLRISRLWRGYLLAGVLAMFMISPTLADETCNSPFVRNLIKGQEDYVYIWTLGVDGVGDGFDKLVTIDVNPGSSKYGKVIDSVSVGRRGEAHHMGFTEDRRYLWAGGLDDSAIYIFDVFTNPAKPSLVRTIGDMPQRTGLVGPHTFYAMPGRMLVQFLSNSDDHGGVSGMAMFTNKGDLVNTYSMPTTNGGDGYAYDIGINPRKNVMLTSSFTGWNNYMMDFGKLVQDSEAMKRFGNTVVLWNAKSMKPKKVFSVPGSPLEIRWSLNKQDNWAVVATALTSKIWLIKQDANGEWQAREVADIGDPSKIPLPVDISIAANGKGLWVNTFMDGKTRYFDMTDPEHPRQTYEKVTGTQVNMVSQSWDGKRVYVTSSLLANWDKKGENDEQFLRAFNWDGKELTPAFEVDFYKEKLGRAHHMKFGSDALKAAYVDSQELAARR